MLVEQLPLLTPVLLDQTQYSEILLQLVVAGAQHLLGHLVQVVLVVVMDTVHLLQYLQQVVLVILHQPHLVKVIMVEAA